MSNKQKINGKEIDIEDLGENREHPEVPNFIAFKAGQLVQFKGLIVGDVRLKPRRGRLLDAPKNISSIGAVTIEGDTEKLIFNPNGSLYCHAQYGILLEAVRETPIK